jgi:hypothetical protein
MTPHDPFEYMADSTKGLRWPFPYPNPKEKIVSDDDSARRVRQDLALALSRSGNVRLRLGLMPKDAALALGVSRAFFDEHIKPELKVIRRGRLIIIPVKELERWLAEQAERTLPE